MWQHCCRGLIGGGVVERSGNAVAEGVSYTNNVKLRNGFS